MRYFAVRALAGTEPVSTLAARHCVNRPDFDRKGENFRALYVECCRQPKEFAPTIAAMPTAIYLRAAAIASSITSATTKGCAAGTS